MSWGTPKAAKEHGGLKETKLSSLPWSKKTTGNPPNFLTYGHGLKRMAMVVLIMEHVGTQATEHLVMVL